MINKVFNGLGYVSLLFILSVTVVACGGGGGGGGSNGGKSVSGTAATGAPIANAQINIVGAAGGTVTAMTGADGSYTADVSTLTAPYLVKVVTSGNVTLYSVGNVAGTINVHPLSDLIVRMWYKVKGTTADTAYADPVTNPPPSATEVDVMSSVVTNIVAKWLDLNGVDAASFNSITTAFTANSTGFDKVLDTLSVSLSNISGPVISITAGADGFQTTNMTLNNSTGTITSSTSITVGSVTSTSFNTAVIPASSAEQTALTGVLTTLSNMATVINAKGSSLAVSDIMPFIDSNYLASGQLGTDFANGVVSGFANSNGTLDGFTVDHIISFDSGKSIIAVEGKLTTSSNGQTVVQKVDGNNGDGLFFKLQSDNSWKFYGDQRRVKLNLKTETVQRMAGTGSNCTTGCDGVYYDVEIQLIAPAASADAAHTVNSVSSATVSGVMNNATTLTNASMTLESGTFTDGSFVSEHFDLLSGSSSTFYELLSPSDFPVAGTVFTVNVNFQDGTTAVYPVTLGASTSEALTLQSGVETTVGHSANTSLGNSITLSWNLPVSFPIANVYMYADVSDGTNYCDVNGPALSTSSTTGTMTLPSTCNGNPVATSNTPSINVVVEGPFGESTSLWYGFQ